MGRIPGLTLVCALATRTKHNLDSAVYFFFYEQKCNSSFILLQGEAGANVLVGIQVPKEEMHEFESRADSLGYEYTSEMKNKTYRLLLQ